MVTDSREAFEAWCKESNLDRCPQFSWDGVEYMNPEMQGAWQAWQHQEQVYSKLVNDRQAIIDDLKQRYYEDSVRDKAEISRLQGKLQEQQAANDRLKQELAEAHERIARQHKAYEQIEATKMKYRQDRDRLREAIATAMDELTADSFAKDAYDQYHISQIYTKLEQALQEGE